MTRIRRAVPVLDTEDTEAAKAFYAGFLGFDVAMDEPGFATFSSPSNPTAQIIAGSERGVQDITVTVEVEDAAAMHERAQREGREIVYPLTDEPWGVRRFFVRAPGGHVINVAQHLR